MQATRQIAAVGFEVRQTVAGFQVTRQITAVGYLVLQQTTTIVDLPVRLHSISVSNHQ